MGDTPLPGGVREAGPMSDDFRLSDWDEARRTDDGFYDVRSGVYGRVPEALGDPLTEAEALALPDDTQVIIVWSGGNGPHRYWIRHYAERTFALTEQEVEDLDADRAWPSPWKDPLHFVGSQRFHTRVWRVSPSDENGVSE